MRYVKCLYNGVLELGYGSNVEKPQRRLSVGKIYEVNELINDNIVVITDNLGDQISYSMISYDKVWFEDVTAEMRDKKLNDLGI